jgi:hypothetical protein
MVFEAHADNSQVKEEFENDPEFLTQYSVNKAAA